jgi:hypothetical protein
MLSKILTASALGGQLWIKDQLRAKPQDCVLELVALYVLSEASGKGSDSERLILTGLATVFCANFSRLSKFAVRVNTEFTGNL